MSSNNSSGVDPSFSFYTLRGGYAYDNATVTGQQAIIDAVNQLSATMAEKADKTNELLSKLLATQEISSAVRNSQMAELSEKMDKVFGAVSAVQSNTEA